MRRANATMLWLAGEVGRDSTSGAPCVPARLMYGSYGTFQSDSRSNTGDVSVIFSPVLNAVLFTTTCDCPSG